MLLTLWLHLMVITCFAINVPDVYQESVLKRYRSYNDVAIFHYYVPTQVTRATWEFAAFMDHPGCTPREVFIHIQPGSYPVINPDNSTFPEGLHVDQTQQFVINTVTKFQSHDALVFHAFNPTPGSWFSVAYIPDWNIDITQQGLTHKCRYSLGSIASWSRHPDVMVLSPHITTFAETISQYTYFKVYVPDNIWLLDVTIANCTIRIVGFGDGITCLQEFGLQADSLPFPVEVNVSNDGSFIYSQPQPRIETYYYILVAALSEISFFITVTMKECVPLWSSGFFEDPSTSPSITSLTSTTSLSSPLFTSRHSNQSVNQDWQDALSVANHSITTNGTESGHIFPMARGGGFLGAPNMRSVDGPLSSDDYQSDTECLSVFAMARIKHAQDFTDSFLLQGKDRYTSLLSVSDTLPVALKMELLPFLDIGGTLKIGVKLVEPPQNSLDQAVSISICVSQGQLPTYLAGHIICGPHLGMSVAIEGSSNSSSDLIETVKFIPFPKPGLWYITFETKCYDSNITLPVFNDSISTMPCHFDLMMVYLNVQLQPCGYDGNRCGDHGTCEENHKGQFFYYTCRCSGGWRGWGCTDGTHAIPPSELLMKTLLLTLSNAFFIPAVVLSIKRGFHTEAVVYAFTMFFSTFYHACDEDIFSYCMLRFEVLQFCDFYSAILSFWVTLIAMANLPPKLASVAHMGGALGIAFGVEYQRTGLWVFAVPVGTGMIIMIASWGRRCLLLKSCRPSNLSWIWSVVPGTILAVTGLCLFAFIETEKNYKYVHSFWHVIIALSIVFLLPRHQLESSVTSEEPPPQVHQPTDDSELVDVSDYASLTSDFQHLLR